MRKLCGCCGSRLDIKTMYKIKIPLLKRIRFFCIWCIKKEIGEIKEVDYWNPKTERFQMKVFDNLKNN